MGAHRASITDADCLTAARNIKIVHEPQPLDEAFVVLAMQYQVQSG